MEARYRISHRLYEEYKPFVSDSAIYFLNESLGRPVQKMAAPVVAVMITGILLNVLYWLGLFVPA